MVAHHEGAVATAETEPAEGLNPDVPELARTVVETQRAGLERVRELGASCSGRRARRLLSAPRRRGASRG